jgi:hypothetical protein
LTVFACGEEIDMRVVVIYVIATGVVLRVMYVLIDAADNMEFIFGYLNHGKEDLFKIAYTHTKKLFHIIGEFFETSNIRESGHY